MKEGEGQAERKGRRRRRGRRSRREEGKREDSVSAYTASCRNWHLFRIQGTRVLDLVSALEFVSDHEVLLMIKWKIKAFFFFIFLLRIVTSYRENTTWSLICWGSGSFFSLALSLNILATPKSLPQNLSVTEYESVQLLILSRTHEKQPSDNVNPLADLENAAYMMSSYRQLLASQGRMSSSKSLCLLPCQLIILTFMKSHYKAQRHYHDI